MAVTKRTRFEVLRRDGFRCRYCGATPTEGELTVDHVVPVALGGSDAPDNLVAACRACNSGKASSSPDQSLVANVSDDAVRWALAMRAAQQQMVADVATRDAYVRQFVDAWMLWDEKTAGLTDHWESTVRRWCDDQFPIEALVECVNIAMGRRIPLYRVFPYVCGIVRNRVIEMQAGAKAELDGAAEPEPAEASRHAIGCTWCRDSLAEDACVAEYLSVMIPEMLLTQHIDGGKAGSGMIDKYRWVA